MKYQEDQVYIEKVKNGDLASYSFLVDRYKDMAFTIARKILRNVEDAEDAAQESFVKAYQLICQFEGKSKFSTWLYTIVYRTAISKLQKHGIQISSLNEDINENYTDDYDFSQLNTMEQTEQQKYVREAIDRLPETDAVLVTLYYINENTIREIEQITGLSISNIKVRLFRSRKILENSLRFLL